MFCLPSWTIALSGCTRRDHDSSTVTRYPIFWWDLSRICKFATLSHYFTHGSAIIVCHQEQRGDETTDGVRPSVFGYGKDSAFALRDFGARIFTGGAWRGLRLSSPLFLCSMLFAECDPLDVQLQHHRFGPRLSFVRRKDLSLRRETGEIAHFSLNPTVVRRSPGRWCAGSASDKNPS